MSYYWSLTGPLAVILSALILRRRLDSRWFKRIAIWVSLVFIALAVLVFRGLLAADWHSVFLATTGFIALTSAWDSVYWLGEHRHISPHRYFLWWGLFWAALLVISISQNLALSWLALEFSTLASGALIIEMGDQHSLEAAWKYIVIASVGLVLGLIGIVFIYASLKFQGLALHTLDYSNLHAQYENVAPMVRQLATIFIVSGFGTKAGLVPFHTWLPDAHSEAPSPVSGLLSGILLGLSLFTVAQFVNAVPVPAGAFLAGSQLLTIFGVVSLVVGSLALLVQHDIKRLLAYSSIEQVGIIAVALGIGTRAAFFAALLQFVFHAIVKSSLFYGAGHLSVSYGTKRLDGINGLISKSKAGSFGWALGILALAGLPPLGLAYSEWLIIEQLWLQHSYVVVFLVTGALTLTFAALIHHMLRTLWFDDQPVLSAPSSSHDTSVQGAI